MNGTLSIVLRPSAGVAGAIAAAHAVACWARWVGLPPAAAAVAGAGLILSGMHHVSAALHRSTASLAALRWEPDGRFLVAGPAGDWREARVVAWAIPVHWLLILVAREAGGARRAGLVFAGATGPDAFRALRVRLRWQAAGAKRRDTAR